MKVVLLPGMDGTGRLFAAFREAVPDTMVTNTVEYGTATTDADLLRCVRIPEEPFAIVAESFSGALAVQIGATAPAQLKAIVLVASFMRRPRNLPHWFAATVSPMLFTFSPPRWAVRWALLGPDAPEADVVRFRETLRSVPAEVLTSRLRSILGKDVTNSFAQCRIPILFVQAKADRVVPLRVLHELLSVRPGLEHVTIDGPHLLLQRRPLESAAVIVPFLERFLS